ncbi:MAG: hypothetical protein QM689_12665 [Oscillospiraceae bacterium]
MDYNKLAKEVHENAVAHGWWETEKEFGELIALLHSEVSEALEEYRKGHEPDETYYAEDGKPQGIPSEIADLILRALDICGRYDIHVLKFNLERARDDMESDRGSYDCSYKGFGDLIAQEHELITGIYTSREHDRINEVIMSGVGMALYYGIDIESVIMEKHEYNKNRPYKHGGKML